MFWQRHAGPAVAYPRLEYCPSILLKHVWPQEGRASIPVVVELEVVNAVLFETVLLAVVVVVEP